ncbi:MAG: hypothetical protein Q9163_004114 [Psora crenata]
MARRPRIHTYHCTCSILLLATPYSISSLPRRAAPPSLDRAYILPLPVLSHPSKAADADDGGTAGAVVDTAPGTGGRSAATKSSITGGHAGAGQEQEQQQQGRILPSLLTPALRPAKKLVVVRREDGFEKRRMWRCGRCGVGLGYEIEREDGGAGLEEVGMDKRGKVLYLFEAGLVETEDMGKEVEGVNE